jgi:1,4-dihydroxy-6-naphthoate synthase
MSKQEITIGFSPCPNDTFIFDALVNNKIDTGNYIFNVCLEDVQTLNEWALQEKLMVTKLSYGVWPKVKNNYNLLQSGSALGLGVGPLLIAKNEQAAFNIENTLIAIPGENTTANMLFSFAYPKSRNKIFLRYDEIEAFVLAGKGHGVIIHENRFTYEAKGLYKIKDLGDYWESQTQVPIPLGGIVAHKSISKADALAIDKLINESIKFAFANYPKLTTYVTQHAQEMSEAVMRQHIDLYVNEFTLNLGEKGNAAIKKLEDIFENKQP